MRNTLVIGVEFVGIVMDGMGPHGGPVDYLCVESDFTGIAGEPEDYHPPRRQPA